MTNEIREEEVWKTYPEFSFIEASNLGRIRTKDRFVPLRNGGKRFIKGRVLKQQFNKNGYMYVEFKVNSKAICLRVNRVVAICFIPNPYGLPEVNHIDNDRTNNVASNLEWCTRQYNSDYKKNFGTSQAEVSGRPVIAVNPETSEVFWFKSQGEAARQLDIFEQNVRKVANGERRQTGGYWFTYVDENASEKTRSKFGDKVADKVEKLMNKNKTV